MRAVLTMLLLLSACGGAATQPQPAPSAPAAPTPSGEPQTAEPSQPEAAIPRAKIIEIMPGKDSADDRRVKITFDNPTKSSCTFTAYTVIWSGGRKTIEEKPFEIPPGGKRQRVLLMHPNDGDLAKLKVDGAEIEVNAGCADVP